MRKHFLLLFLMALLPLAGWAQSAGTGNISATSIYIEPFGYGGFDLDDVSEESPATITPASGMNIKITDGGATLTKDTEYTVGAEFYNVNDNGEVSGIAGAMVNNVFTAYSNYTTLPVGKYAVKITGINTYSGTAYGVFEVKPAILEITFHKTDNNSLVAFGDFEKEYGTSDPTIASLVTDGLIVKATVKNSAYTDANNNEVAATEVNLDEDQVNAITIARKDNNSENANAKVDGTYFNATQTSAGSGYSLVFDGLEGVNVANYDIYYQVTDLKIKQINLATAVTSGVGFYNGTAAAQFANTVYNGENRVPALTVTYKNNDLFKNNAAALEVGTDYTLSYTYSTTENGADQAVDAARNAGYYKVFLNGVANGNYATPVDGNNPAPVQYGAFKITKAAADVVVMTKTKVYDGNPYVLTGEGAVTPDFSISGLVPSDEGKVDLSTLTAQAAQNVTLSKNVGSYNVVANPTNAKIVYSEENQIAFGLNYDVTCLPNAWTITQRTLKIAASDVEVNLHADLNALMNDEQSAPTLTFTSPGVEDFSFTNYEGQDDAAKIEAAFEIVLAEDASAETAGTFRNTFLVQRKPVGEGYAQDTYDAATALLANYDWKTEGNITNGTLTVNSPAFTIRPLINTNLVYGTVIEPTYYAYAGSGNAITILTDADINKDNIEYQFSADGGKTWTTDVPFGIGTYKAKVAAKSGTAIGKGNYAGINPTTPIVQFAINQKVINITVQAVELWQGATKTILNKKGRVSAYADQLVTVNGVQEKINFEYDFVAPAEDAKYTVTTNAETGEKTLGFLDEYTAGNYITIALVDKDGYANDNYKLNIVANGQLNKTDLAALELELDGNAEEVEDAMDICKANDDVTYKVTIKGRKLVANDWNVLVLPFDITPYEFTQAIGGYAIFNTLQSANAANNTVKFGIELANLPANEPFLVKPLAEVDFDATTGEDENEDRAYIFNGVTIVKGTPTKDDVNGVKFIGTYADTKVVVAEDAETFDYVADGGETGKNFMFLATPTGGKAAWYTATKGTTPDESYNWFTLGYTKAYLDFTDSSLSAPLITVEEADGSTTAISAVTSDGVAVKAEGWYTIDGMKLNAAPTQKGVYINNGKKIVVK